MEFGREAVAEHLVKNKIPKLENLKLDLSGAIDGMKDFEIKLDEIARDIRDKKDNAMAMEFVKVIGGMLVQNGVSLKIEECRDENIEMNMAKNKIEVKYNVRIDGLDFSEHDKPFEDKIAELEEEIHRLREERREIRKRCASDGELHLFDLKRYGRLRIVAKDVMAENELLKKRISEIENFSCQAEQESESMILELKQRIAELESEKSENCEEEPISDDARPSSEWYENRYQQDCITINRLNTTIDVLIHKIEYLRQFAGLE